MQQITNAILVATLGGQPQTVTFALDALLAQGETVTDVYLIHSSLDTPRTRQALQRLQPEFLDDYYAGRRCRLRRVPIRANGAELTDISTSADAEATWQCIRDLIANLKGQRLHLCLSGGRRMMALLVMSAALLCDHQDRIWHTYTPEATLRRVKDGALMHVDPCRWCAVDPGAVGRLFSGAACSGANADICRAGAVAPCYCRRRSKVPPRMGAAEHASARSAARLCPGVASRSSGSCAVDRVEHGQYTQNHHFILSECRVAWNIPDDELLDYRFIRERFAAFIERV